MTPARRVPSDAADGAAVEPEDRFRRRGFIVLAILVVVQLLGFAVTLVAPGPPELLVALLVWFSGSVVFMAWLAVAVRAAQPWARPVAWVTLWCVAITGVIETLVALGQSRINIPIGTILALYALAVAGPFRLPVDPDQRGRATFGVMVALVLFVVPPLVGLFSLRI